MPVRQAQRHILSDLKLELFIYRIFLLSPFEIQQNQKLATAWRVKLYICSALVVYVTLRISFFLLFQGNDKILEYFSTNGKMFMYVAIFDLTFSSLFFVAIVLNGLITNTHQIKFYEDLHLFDEIILATISNPITRSRSRTANTCALIVALVYYIAYFCSSLIYIDTPILTPFQHFALLSTIYIDNILSLLTALYYVNCIQLCRERLEVIRKLLRNHSNFRTEQMHTVLQLYIRIRSQILLINRFMGFMVLLKITHDFTLCSSIMYLICSSLYRAEYIFQIILWFGETIVGTLLMALTAELLMTEVYSWILFC